MTAQASTTRPTSSTSELVLRNLRTVRIWKRLRGLPDELGSGRQVRELEQRQDRGRGAMESKTGCCGSLGWVTILLAAFCSLALAQGPDSAAVEIPAEPPQADPAPPADAAPPAYPPPADAAPQPAAAKERGLSYRGFVLSRYRYRNSGGSTDQDIDLDLGADVGDRHADPVTFHFLGRASADIDGHRDHQGFYVFDSLTDTWDSRYQVRLSHGYVDFHRLSIFQSIRIGRQTMYGIPVSAYFDGAHVATKEFRSAARLKFGVYGGHQVHRFESSPSGDWLIGAYVQIRPWTGGKLALHYLHAEDRYLGEQERDDHYALSYWQSISEKLQLHARYTFLEDRSRDLLMRATWYDAEADFRLEVAFKTLLEKQKRMGIDVDAFTTSLRDYARYWELRLAAAKYWQHFGLDGGLELRELYHDSDESLYNHEFIRVYTTATLIDLPVEGLDFSVTGQFFDSEGSEGIFAAGGEIAYEPSKQWRFVAGTSYALYKIDVLQDTEREDVQTYYGEIEWSPWEFVRGALEYSFEDADEDDQHVVEFKVRFSF